jgi:hypothetical protein
MPHIIVPGFTDFGLVIENAGLHVRQNWSKRR